MLILPKLKYRCNTIAVKILTGCFNFYMEEQWPRTISVFMKRVCDGVCPHEEKACGRLCEPRHWFGCEERPWASGSEQRGRALTHVGEEASSVRETPGQWPSTWGDGSLQHKQKTTPCESSTPTPQMHSALLEVTVRCLCTQLRDGLLTRTWAEIITY